MNSDVMKTSETSLESECPYCHSIYEITSQEIGTIAACVKCNKKFRVAPKKPSPEEVLAQEIKVWEQRVAEMKTKYEEELAKYDRSELNYVDDIQSGGAALQV